MRALLLVMIILASSVSHAQRAPAIDIMNVKLGKPFPVQPLMPAKPREGTLPFYSITVPMPERSPLKVFFEYDIDAMFDTGNVYALRAQRTFDSTDSCVRGLKTLIAPLTDAYRLTPSKSEFTLFQADTADVEVRAHCAYVEGSAYPTLALFVRSKAEEQRVREQMKRSHVR